MKAKTSLVFLIFPFLCYLFAMPLGFEPSFTMTMAGIEIVPIICGPRMYRILGAGALVLMIELGYMQFRHDAELNARAARTRAAYLQLIEQKKESSPAKN